MYTIQKIIGWIDDGRVPMEVALQPADWPGKWPLDPPDPNLLWAPPTDSQEWLSVIRLLLAVREARLGELFAYARMGGICFEMIGDVIRTTAGNNSDVHRVLYNGIVQLGIGMPPLDSVVAAAERKRAQQR